MANVFQPVRMTEPKLEAPAQPEPQPVAQPEPPKPEAVPQAQPPAPPQSPIRALGGKEFIAYFDSQIEQSHAALEIFQPKPQAPAQAETAQEPDQAPAQPTEAPQPQSFWERNKIYILAAGGLLVLALAATLFRRFFGGEGGDWRTRGGEGPPAPVSDAGGAAQQPEPEPQPNNNPYVSHDLAAMALGIRR
jgi:hypothetical protein